jgi:hypothetical protein
MNLEREPAHADWYQERALTTIANGGKVGTNDYGMPVSVHTCEVCGHEFTCCPPSPTETVCLSIECPSYDPARDVDRMFFGDEVDRQEDTDV